jgi:hypothetical protein
MNRTDPVVSRVNGWVDSRLQQDLKDFTDKLQDIIFGVLSPGTQLLVLLPQAFYIAW